MKQRVIWSILVIFAIFLGLLMGKMTYKPAKEVEAVLRMKENLPQIEEELFANTIYQDVIFTSYWPSEPRHNAVTHSGISVDKFYTNEEGWYTYGALVVLATATNKCLDSSIGACKAYTGLPDEYRVYDFLDIIDFEINGKTYKGIVLDSCGACMRTNNGEAYQRFDIYVSDAKYSVGKVEGGIKIYD